MKLRTYLAVATFAFSILGLVTVGRLVYTTHNFRDTAHSIKDSIALLRGASQVEASLFDFARECLLSAITYPITDDPGALETAARLRAALVSLSQTTNDADELAMIRDLGVRIEDYIVRAAGQTGAPLVAPVPPAFAGTEHDLLRRLNLLEAHAVRRVDAEQARMASMNEVTELGGSVVVLLFVFAGASLLIAGRRLVYHPIIALEKSISRFAAGDTSTGHAEVRGTVEIQKVASVFNAMAEKLNKQRDHQLRFLAAVAHDLRNPLNAIVMSMDLLAANKGVSGADRDELFGIVGRQVRNLDRLVGDLLDTARIEAGQLDLKVEWVDVVRVASESSGLFRTLSPLHRVVFEGEQEGSLYCRGDIQRLGQVLNNVLSNAIKYSPEGGDVRVTVRTDGPDVLICVSDQGVGIGPGDMQSIFQPFNRSNATRDSIPGVGIGLSVSRRIVEAHGGAIEVESTPGRGSTFRIRLPLGREVVRRKPLAAVPRDVSPPSSSSGKERGADAGIYRAPGPAGA